MHLSQINDTATYDAARSLLEITGTTRDPEPSIVAIHAALKLVDEAHTGALHTTVPEICLRLPKWMARFEGKFELGTATVSGLKISYEENNSSLNTQAWAQTVEIVAGTIHDTDWPTEESSSPADAVA